MTDLSKDTPIGFIGAGKACAALANGLTNAGYRVAAIGSRTQRSAEAVAAQLPSCDAVGSLEEVVLRTDLVFLTVPDDTIAAVAAALQWRSDSFAVHCSGGTPLAALAAAEAAGATVAAFHPLQTFATRNGPPQPLTGSTFALETHSPALTYFLSTIAADLGCGTLALHAADRALYHVSGVMASNFVVTMIAQAAGLWEHLGSDRSAGLAALLPLVRGTVRNLEMLGLPDALTGPIARSDVGTVEGHLDALNDREPGLARLYSAVARETIQLAIEQGRLTPETTGALLALIERDPINRER